MLGIWEASHQGILTFSRCYVDGVCFHIVDVQTAVIWEASHHSVPVSSCLVFNQLMLIFFVLVILF